MTQCIGPKGAFNVVAANPGPARLTRLLHFVGRATTGQCDNNLFRKDEAVVGVVDLTKGRVLTSSFASYTDTGQIVLSDTGGLGADGLFTGHDLVAFVLTDTGTIG